MLKKKLSNYDIILASQSPRRINFFNELNIKFKSLKLDFDESYPNNLIAEQITDFIANKKASYYSDLLNKNTVVITSDTIVWLNGKAIGKPKNNENAKEILQTLSGKTHKVITSFCIKTFSFKSCAKKHEKIHTGEGFVACGQCNKVFRTNNQLKIHELGIHSGIKVA